MNEREPLPSASATRSAPSVELALLCRCIRAALAPAACAAGAPEPREVRLDTVPDWERLLSLARHHRCAALLLAGSRQSGEGMLPTAVTARLSGEVMAGAARSAFMLQRLAEILERLARRQIRPLVLKGPGAGMLAYPDAALRPYDDLDLLVAPSDFARAEAALVDDGFVPLVRLSEAEARTQMRLGWDRGFRSPSGDYCVELCSGIAPAFFRFRLPETALREGCRTIDGGAGPIRVPAPEVLLLLLCAHGTKHLWHRLVWMADIAGMVGREGAALDWTRVGRLARESGGLRMLALGLTLARQYAGLAGIAPAGLWRGDDPAVTVLADRVAPRLEQPQWQEPSAKVEIRFHLAARERQRDRWGYLWRLAATPGYGDWRWISLPEGVRGLYYVLRPLRLAVLALRSGRQGSSLTR